MAKETVSSTRINGFPLRNYLKTPEDSSETVDSSLTSKFSEIVNSKYQLDQAIAAQSAEQQMAAAETLAQQCERFLSIVGWDRKRLQALIGLDVVFGGLITLQLLVNREKLGQDAFATELTALFISMSLLMYLAAAFHILGVSPSPEQKAEAEAQIKAQAETLALPIPEVSSNHQENMVAFAREVKSSWENANASI